MTTIEETEVATTKSSLEPLIFERSKPGRRGYQLPALDVPEQPLDSLLPSALRRDATSFPC